MAEVSLPAWWMRYPGRLEYELEMLQAAGIGVVLDEEIKAEREVVQLALTIPDEHTGRGELALVATFPEFYPFVRPAVTAPDLDMGHHQHPFGKNLCLIGRSSRAWTPNDTLAWLVTEQLGPVLELGSTGVGGAGEEDQGEPFSDYYTYVDGAVMLIDSDTRLPEDVSCGEFAALLQGPLPLQDGHRTCVFMLHFTDSEDRVVAIAPAQLVKLGNGHPRIQGRWSRLAEPVRRDDPQAIWKAAEAADAGRPGGSYNFGADRFEFRVVVYPEEHRRHVAGNGWALVLKKVGSPRAPGKSDRRSRDPRRRQPRWPDPEYALIRAGRAGPADIASRNAALAGLADKQVLLVGAGALGSVIATQLARAGLGELTIIDRDVLEAGNLARHGCTIHHVGLAKAVAVSAMARDSNPYTTVRSVVADLGGLTDGNHRRSLQAWVRSADVVVDATAEVGIQEVTADLARRSGRTWLMVEATNGAWGGTVVRVPSDADWCFACFQWHRYHQTIPLPPADPAPPMQPVGCAEPTFTGAGYDLSEVSLQGARTVVSTLLGEPTHDAANVTLPYEGGPRVPQWCTYLVEPHESCTHTDD